MLAIVLVQRRDLFVPMIQPPLLLAVSVLVAIAATGSLPASGGLVSSAPAVGAPLINGFPAMAYEALADLHHPAASLLDGRTEGTLRHALSFQPPPPRARTRWRRSRSAPRAPTSPPAP